MKPIEGRYARAVIMTGQQGAVSTRDVVEIFLNIDLAEKIERAKTDVVLSKEEALQLRFAINAMGNTFLDIAMQIPKQRVRKDDRVDTKGTYWGNRNRA
jgi:hypothetical protein